MLFSSVIDAFPRATLPLEGCVLWPYQDVFGLVTTGYGCLCNTEAELAKISWVGDPSSATIANELAKLRAYPRALHWRRYEAATTLRMTQASADALLDARAADFAAYMQAHFFADFEDWPADAQLALLLMAWACGPGFPAIFKTFTAFAKKRAWADAAKCAKIKVGTPGHSDYNPGIVPRNAQIALCLANATEIDSDDGMPTPALYWPGHVTASLDPSSSVQGVPHSVLMARAAQRALAEFDVEHYGLTGSAHELEVAA